MLNIIFMAPPASGKGTLSKMLSEKYLIPHISMGDILREKVLLNDETGIKIKNLIDKGNFVSDEISTELVIERLKNDDVKNGFILDGYPRDLNQALELEKILTNKIAIFLNIDKEEALRRILGRLTCPSCHSVYNTTSEVLKPKTDNICDKCGSTLIKRDDDTFEVFETRFNNYMEMTKPVIDFYKNNNNFYELNALNSPNETFEVIEKIIMEVSND